MDAEPKRDERGSVDITLVKRGNGAPYTEPIFFDMPADDARLLGLKLIRAADASERRSW